MARRTRSVRRRRSRRGGMFGKKPLSSQPPVMPVPKSAYDEQAKARSKEFSARIRNDNNQANAVFFGRNNLPGAEDRVTMAENSATDLATAQRGEIAVDKKIDEIKKGTYGYEPAEKGGRRRSRRRRGGVIGTEQPLYKQYLEEKKASYIPPPPPPSAPLGSVSNPSTGRRGPPPPGLPSKGGRTRRRRRGSRRA